MGLLAYLYSANLANEEEAQDPNPGAQSEAPAKDPSSVTAGDGAGLPVSNGTTAKLTPLTKAAADSMARSTNPKRISTTPQTSTNSRDDDHRTPGHAPFDKSPKSEARRFSLRSLTFAPGPTKRKPTLSTTEDHEKKAHASAAFSKRVGHPVLTSSEKRAKESALIVRSLIVGPMSVSLADSKATKAVTKPDLSKLKVQLMRPKSANKVIAQLRALPVETETQVGKKEGETLEVRSAGPIHAVCLEYTEDEADRKHFRRLYKDTDGDGKNEDVIVDQVVALQFPSVATASIGSLTNMFRDMRLISLVSTPDLGLGQPGDEEGLLAGAVPTAETIMRGVVQITPQLMALGFATGRALLPDHKGVHPPTDRMSVLTYWWGLELVLPPSTLKYLANAQSISNTVINFLTALAMINNGVREILPFVRYIAQFIDFEFNAIQTQNRGQGVVCAATWIMPAAMVPRPWDFPLSEGEMPAADVERCTDTSAVFLPKKQGAASPIVIPSRSKPRSIPKVVVTSPTATMKTAIIR